MELPTTPEIEEPTDSEVDLTDRRRFMRNTAVGISAFAAPSLAEAKVPESWKVPGNEFSNYGQPHADQQNVIRWISTNSSVAGDGVSWTPLQDLEGTITPNGLHFERHHNGVPDIDTSQWELVVHGLVDKALAFNLDALRRYPMTSKIAFIECGGNSNSLWHPTPVQAPVGYVHGLLSCSEWTGVRLADLLNEAGLKEDAKWLVADGLDAAGVTSSLPLDKVMDDVMIALYQNGEPIRAENGYPARLLVPGWEGICNVKWLTSLQITDTPLLSKFDTVSYTDLHKDGIAERFSFEMKVKSVITSPSPGQNLSGSGYYEIRGLAWTGNGPVTRVDVSVDDGQNWTEAELQSPVLDKALTRFRLPWQWDGKPAKLKSRAYDHLGQTQPEREALIAEKGISVYYHYNAIVVWSISDDGHISHVYA